MLDPWIQFDAMLFFIGIQTIIIIVCLIWTAMLSFKMRKRRKLFDQLLTIGNTDESLEAVLDRLFDRIDKVETTNQSIEEKNRTLADVISKQKGNVGIVRFHAFGNEGNDLSFSIAMIDQKESGFVLTSIYGRDESRVYAKPLEKGNSIYLLTEEEKKAIQDAKKKVLL